MARYMRTDLGRGHSKLSGPAVIGPGIYYRGIQIYYAQAVKRAAPGPQRREPLSVLRPPRVVTPAPVVIYFGPRVYLNVMAPERLRRTVTNRAPSFFLRPPAILATNGPSQYVLTYSRRGRPKSFLRPPTDTIGLEDQGRIRRTLVNQHRTVARYRLAPPTVVTQPTGVFYGPAVHLTRIRPPAVHSFLRAPAVVAAEVEVVFGAQANFTQPRKPRAYSRLRPPAVLVVAQIYYGPKVTLVRIRPPRAFPRFIYPTVIASPTAAFGYLAVNLVRIRPPAVHSFLRPAVVAEVRIVYYGPEVTLTRIRPRRTRTFLRPPTDTVGLEDQGRVRTRLTNQHRTRTRFFLRPPAILATSGPSQYALAYSRRGRPRSFLRPPTDVVDLQDQGRVATHLTNQHRTVARYRLEPPTVVRIEYYLGPAVHLTRIKPQPTTTFLRPFTERAFEVSYGPEVHLTYSVRKPGRVHLGAPTDVIEPFEFGVLRVHLAPSRFPVPKSRLEPPAVVGAIVYSGPTTSLAYSRRGRPVYVLRPPRVVFPPITVFFGPATSLAYSRRGRPKSVIRPPRVVFPFFARAIDITLVRQHRTITTYVLRPPRVLRLQEFDLSLRRIRKELAYSVRGRPVYELRPPRVVREAVEIYGPETALAYSRRGRPKSELLPPAVVGRAPFRGILTHLAYSRRGRPISFLQPGRVGQVFRGIQVYLTRNKPRPTTTFLRPPTRVRTHLEFGEVRTYLTRIKHPPALSILFPPTVIGDNERYFGPRVTLVRIKHPPVQHNLRLTLVAFRRPQGDVCGFDIAGSFVCSLEVPGARVSGADAAVHGVSGTSQAGSTVTGSDSAGGSVSGSDRKAT